MSLLAASVLRVPPPQPPQQTQAWHLCVRLPSFGVHLPWAPLPSSLAPGPPRGSCAGDSLSRISRKLCSGKLGISMKVLGGLALFWIVFILGYITGYYVHKCK